MNDSAAVLEMIAIMQFAPERLTRFDVIVPSITKSHILPASLGSPSFVGGPLISFYFSWIFAFVNQHFQFAGFNTRAAKIPSTGVPNSHPHGFTEQS